jgi:hypothetical protein
MRPDEQRDINQDAEQAVAEYKFVLLSDAEYVRIIRGLLYIVRMKAVLDRPNPQQEIPL